MKPFQLSTLSEDLEMSTTLWSDPCGENPVHAMRNSVLPHQLHGCDDLSKSLPVRKKIGISTSSPSSRMIILSRFVGICGTQVRDDVNQVTHVLTELEEH